ncbi:metal ABC transporter permease [Oxalobacteraceae bacterium R-40]|uniref:Metal ABC transporter permease n=1 Tax=Keguizhuia sedimenti TaxID=3064264 RepID=A0ABU1BL19_9BURK|nr:metal ABC transporter permease [Oxalobacteraceae bacterium R-40]
MLELLLWPFIAGLVLTGIHAYFGLHVLARGIVFVDLSLAQVAALGITVAILAGHPVQSAAAYWYALAFAIGGAVLFALARRYEHAVQQEAVIGIVYAVCAALGVIALDRAPQGAEHIKQILIGSILTVGPQEVAKLAALYSAIGLVHWLLRRPLLAASFDAARRHGSPGQVFLWDVIFYGSFALVVTSSVRIAGVLLVFSYLIVPAAIAGLFATSVRSKLMIGWALGAGITAIGLGASWIGDLPTGPAIVAAFGATTALVALGFALRHASFLLMGKFLAGASAVVGILLFAFPQMDHPWLDVVEKAAPSTQDLFLTSGERDTRRDSLESIEFASAEIERLRSLEQDVRWGKQHMEQEKQERLRQYLAGRSEILAGDQLVLQELRAQARARQRYGLGIPLFLLGASAFVFLMRRQKIQHRPDGTADMRL